VSLRCKLGIHRFELYDRTVNQVDADDDALTRITVVEVCTRCLLARSGCWEEYHGDFTGNSSPNTIEHELTKELRGRAETLKRNPS